MYSFATFTRYLALIHLRNRTVLFWNLAFPVLMLVLYGVVFRGDGNLGMPSGFNYIHWVLPGVLVFNALSLGLITSSTLMLNMRETGVLRRLQATPMPSGQLLVAYLVVNVVIVLLQSVIIVVAAVVLFGATVTLTALLLALPMTLVGIGTFLALGQLIGGLVPTAGAAVVAGQLAYFALLFVTDMILPVAALPEWLQRVAVWLPSYAVVQLVRPALMDGTLSADLGRNLAVAAVYALLAGLVAARLFRWEPRR